MAPRSWAEAAYPGLAYFNEVDKGGHFAAWEEPELFSTEVRAAFRSLRQRRLADGLGLQYTRLPKERLVFRALLQGRDDWKRR